MALFFLAERGFDQPRIQLRLRSPLQLPITQVIVDSRKWKRFSGDVIDLGRPNKSVKVEIKYQSKE